MGKLKCEAPGCERDKWMNRDGFAVCRKHYHRLRVHNSFDLPPRKHPAWATCSVEGCNTPSRTIGGKLCEKHYYRKYRTGDLSDPETGRKWFTSHGYVGTYAPLHPLAGKSGALYLHRVVLHDKIGPGVHRCHWCNDEIEWGVKGKRGLVVDHLDNDKANNDGGDLVPACNDCNATRGLFMSWVMKHKDDPFLLKLFTAANDNNPQFMCEATG